MKEEKLLDMTNLEIKQKIDNNNSLIEQILSPNRFTLNTVVAELLAENRRLQAQCKHSFVDGYCEYCYAEEARE